MFVKHVRTLALTAMLTLVALQSVGAQEFKTGEFYAGPRIWIGNLNGAVAVGGQIERGFTKPGDVGSGVISGGLGIDWYSWSYDYPFGGGWSYTVVPVQVFSNYHFAIPKYPKYDPYLGLALVYQRVTASWDGPGAWLYSASGSTTDFAGQGGLRYFISDKFAVQGQVGFGYGTLGLGVTWKF